MSDIQRPPPGFIDDEKSMVSGFLDYQRVTLLRKVDGLTASQMSTAPTQSTMTLGGIVKHLAAVEHSWFQRVFLGEDPGEPWTSGDRSGDPNWIWHSASADTPRVLVTLLKTEQTAARHAIVGRDVEEFSARPNWKGERCSLRWILLHMVQEYARHNGHADLLRETIDGVTGL